MLLSKNQVGGKREGGRRRKPQLNPAVCLWAVCLGVGGLEGELLVPAEI